MDSLNLYSTNLYSANCTYTYVQWNLGISLISKYSTTYTDC